MTERGLPNPFEEHGFDPRLEDLAVQIMKRGRNDQGRPVEVAVDNRVPVTLSEDDRFVIRFMIEHAVGEEAGRSVGYGIESLLRSKIGEQ